MGRLGIFFSITIEAEMKKLQLLSVSLCQNVAKEQNGKEIVIRSDRINDSIMSLFFLSLNQKMNQQNE